MKLRACMVNIVWDFNNIKINIFNRGFIFDVEKIEEVKSSKKNEILGIKKEDIEWVTFTHYRESTKYRKIRQLAFEIEECSWFHSNINENVTLEIFTRDNNNLSVQLEYDKGSGYWYEPTYYICKNGKWKANNDPRFSPTGIMVAGSFKIKVKSKDGKFQHLSPNINVLPSAISVENYEQMLKELLFIRDDLVINKDSKIKINTTEKNNLDEINKILNKLYIFE
ncbi:hypothetical protein Z959_09500 [Clostridium novyi B str. ATCC 27606]|uniref:Uncharacterized protein n=1 Tax=Clostridium novyi B str. ATCC 27606 TaxID=1443123 RepID=A0AA40M5K2_CLONO|nr:hypothetical protein [Clostridium novyi]KEI16565.1 hypothetical protein Z959_09500 [Clostridium novyi B str. ATCC 27606]